MKKSTADSILRDIIKDNPEWKIQVGGPPPNWKKEKPRIVAITKQKSKLREQVKDALERDKKRREELPPLPPFRYPPKYMLNRWGDQMDAIILKDNPLRIK